MRKHVVWIMTCHFAVLGCVAISGCSGGAGEFDVVPVSGTVTCNGEPLGAGVVVQFFPEAADSAVVGKSASGTIDESGSFTLSTYDQGDGAVVGRHRIIIVPAGEAGGDAEEEEADEPEYGDFEGIAEEENNEEEALSLPCDVPSDLFVDISASTSVVNIEMADGGSVSTQ